MEFEVFASSHQLANCALNPCTSCETRLGFHTVAPLPFFYAKWSVWLQICFSASWCLSSSPISGRGESCLDAVWENCVLLNCWLGWELLRKTVMIMTTKVAPLSFTSIWPGIWSQVTCPWGTIPPEPAPLISFKDWIISKMLSLLKTHPNIKK